MATWQRYVVKFWHYGWTFADRPESRTLAVKRGPQGGLYAKQFPWFIHKTLSLLHLVKKIKNHLTVTTFPCFKI